MILIVESNESPADLEEGGGARPVETLLDILPKPATISCPEDLPDHIAKAYKDGAGAIMDGYPTPGGASIRKAIEQAAKHLDPDGKGMLEQRIKALVTKGLISPAIADWAHEVRLGANEGMHEADDLTAEEAEGLRDFAEVFLTNVYTLPARMARGRVAAEKAKKAGKA